jgi:hypothetical protein
MLYYSIVLKNQPIRKSDPNFSRKLGRERIFKNSIDMELDL